MPSRYEQLQRHLHRLDHRIDTAQGLLVLTPDEERPAMVDQIADPRLF